jgi:hypothetical protein
MALDQETAAELRALGDRVKMARQLKGLTQKDVDVKKASRTVWQQLERGDVAVLKRKPVTLAVVATAIGWPPEDLISAVAEIRGRWEDRLATAITGEPAPAVPQKRRRTGREES